MAHQTYRELAYRLSQLPQTYGGTFPVAALSAEARSEGQYVKVAFLGRNGCGKSSIIDMLVGGMLPTEDSEEGEIGQDEKPGSSRTLLELAGDQEVEEALAEGKFWHCVNPEPRGHPNHLGDATAAFKGYYTFQRTQQFGKLSYLLPIGQPTGSTTQNDVQVSNDPVPSCTIYARCGDKLPDMELECLTKMEQMMRTILEEGEDDEAVLKEVYFKHYAVLFKQLTGIDVEDMYERGQSVQAVLEGLQADRKQKKRLLLPALAKLADCLKHLHLQGAQENLSSDIWFLREALANPVEALLRAAGVQLSELDLPDELKADEGRTLQGLLIDYMHVTVPAPALGSVMLIDKPGLNDSRSLVKYNIAARLNDADNIFLVTHKSLADDTVLLDYLVDTSAWTTAQLASDHPRGTLTVVRYHEKEASHAQLKELYDGEAMRDAQATVITSREALRTSLRNGLALPTLDAGGRRARIDRFLDNNCFFICLYPATFLSIALELASDVCAALQDHDVHLPNGYNPQAVVLRLSQSTRMYELLMRIGKLSSFRDLQMVEWLRTAIEATKGALTEPAGEGAAAAPAAAPASQAAAAPASAAELEEQRAMWEARFQQLEKVTSKPAKLNSYVQDVIKGRHQSGSWTDVKRALRSTLDDIREEAVKHCQNWLKDDRIAKATVRKLKLDKKIGLGRLRAILKRDLNRRLRERDGRMGIAEHIQAELCQTVQNELQNQVHEDRLYDAHAAAAHSVADLLMDVLDNAIGLRQLAAQEAQWWPNYWRQQLVKRIRTELWRAAQSKLIAAPAAVNQVLQSRLSTLLRRKMGPKLAATERLMPKPARDECWGMVQTAIMDGLAEVSSGLPAELEGLFEYDYLEEEITKPFFQEVKSGNHQIAAVEMGQSQRSGQRKNRKLAEKRASQPCLWRCIYRFLADLRECVETKRDEATVAAAAAAVAAAQGAAQQQHLAQQQAQAHEQAHAQEARQRLLHQLLQELGYVDGQLAKLTDMYKGQKQAEQQQRLGNGLAQQMFQSARQTQVDTLRRAQRDGILIDDVYVADDKLQFDEFSACRGLMVVPDQADDSLGSLQVLFDRLAGRSLYCAPLVPDFNTGSALEAAYISIFRSRMDEPLLRRVHDMLAFEMECDRERLSQDLRLVPQYGLAGTAPYLEELVAGTWWTSLLELQWLACVLRVDFIVFSTLPSPGSRSGHKIAFYIQCRRDMHIGGPLHTIKAYPLAVCLRQHEGVVRPWFLALHHDRAVTQAARDGQLCASCCINGSHSLQGSPEEVCLLLKAMAARAANSRAAAERDAAERAAGGSAAKRRRT